ncbi:MAG: SGNH/GDSL hydrolase family protein [Tissierellia bacterium]|nr:SGNH/GDSL hydrolase family protein [Tissierellia bacterium]
MKRNLYVLGDSISMGYGPYLKECIAPYFTYDRKGGADNLDVSSDANAGDSGMVLSYLQEEKKKGRTFDVLLLNCGLHDIRVDSSSKKRQVPLEQYETNLENILSLAKSMAKDILWVSSTPVSDAIHNGRIHGFLRYDEDVVRYNKAAHNIMARESIPEADLYTFIKHLGQDIYRDHIHFKEEISMVQASFIAEELIQYFIDDETKGNWER